MIINLFRRNWPIFLLVALLPFEIWPIFQSGYFSHHDDLQVMRIFEMRKCLEDGQIPCRWVPDMGYGNGFPLFNYYGPSIYYLGALFSLILGFIWSAKALFLLPLIIGPLGIYLLVRRLYDEKSAFVSAVLFMFTPYRALDTYVRGALDENFAICLMPFLLYLSLKFSQDGGLDNFVYLTLVLAFFLITHNIMTVFFVPVFLIWIFFIWLKATEKVKLQLLVSQILAYGLAAFFLIPAFFEKSLVNIDSLTNFDLNFRAHFVTFTQLFVKRYWGYGASIPGPYDTISFQIGWPHWWLVIAALVLLTYQIIKNINHRKWNLFLPIFSLAVFFVSIFMTHNKSSIVWERIQILQFAQFPWRFLSLTSVSVCLLSGYLFYNLKNHLGRVILVATVFISVFLNWQFFRPETFYYQVDDQAKLTGAAWDQQRKAGILDYLPKTAVEPKEAAPQNPIIVSGEGSISSFINRSNFWQFNIQAQKSVRVELPVFYFPNWETYVNGVSYPLSYHNYLGRISLDLKSGSYFVSGKFLNTPVRSMANGISLVSLLVLLSIVIYAKRSNKF